MNLVVLYTYSHAGQPWPNLDGQNCSVVSFVDTETEQNFKASCNSKRISVCGVAKAAHLLDTAATVAREKYSSFIANWPESYRSRGKNFKERFTYRGEVSYWWLSTASAKQNVLYTSFDYLTHLEVVRQCAAEQEQIEGCTYIGDDPTMAGLLREWCRHEQLDFESPLPEPSEPNRHSSISALVKRLLFIGWLVLQIVLIKLVMRLPKHHYPQSLTAFLTLYPGPLEVHQGQVHERTYRDVVTKVDQQPGHRSVIMCWFQGRGLSDLARLYINRRTFKADHRVLLLNTYLTVSDVWLAARSLGFYFAFYWLDRFDRQYRHSFMYDGINIYKLLGPEFRRQFLGNEIPYHLVASRAAGRAVKAQQVQRLVSFLELYPLSRGIIYAAKRAYPEVVTVAYQHANITKMRLWYTYKPEEVLPRSSDNAYIHTMPVPDKYLFQGSAGMNIIRGSGYPTDKCVLTGSPRYDDLGNRVQRGLADGSISADGFLPTVHGGRRIVLISPSSSVSDAQELIEVTVNACLGKSDLSLLVKLHPDCPIDDQVHPIAQKHNFEDIKVAGDNVHDLIEGADLVVTNYSTTGDEAIALGRPVVCYTGLRPCAASYLDLPAAPVTHDAIELGEAIDNMLNVDEYRQHYWLKRDDLVHGSFYQLDGRAADRMVEALLETGPIPTEASSPKVR